MLKMILFVNRLPFVCCCDFFYTTLDLNFFPSVYFLKPLGFMLSQLASICGLALVLTKQSHVFPYTVQPLKPYLLGPDFPCSRRASQLLAVPIFLQKIYH